MQAISLFQADPFFWSQLALQAAVTAVVLAIVRWVLRSSWKVYRSIDLTITYAASVLIVSSGFFLEPVIAELISFFTNSKSTGNFQEFATVSGFFNRVSQSLTGGLFPGLLLGVLLKMTRLRRSAKSAAATGMLVLIANDIFVRVAGYLMLTFTAESISSLIFSIFCDFWGGPIAGVLCRWVAIRTDALSATAGTRRSPPGAITEDAASPDDIKIDRVVFLTGIIGYYWLLISWLAAAVFLALLVITAYFVIVRKQYGFAVEMFFFFGPVLLIVCGGMRWIARGFLSGRKVRAFIGCFVMLAFAAWIGYALAAGWLRPDQIAAAALQTLATLILVVLVISSFRNRQFWRGSSGRN